MGKRKKEKTSHEEKVGSGEVNRESFLSVWFLCCCCRHRLTHAHIRQRGTPFFSDRHKNPEEHENTKKKKKKKSQLERHQTPRSAAAAPAVLGRWLVLGDIDSSVAPLLASDLVHRDFLCWKKEEIVRTVACVREERKKKGPPSAHPAQ